MTLLFLNLMALILNLEFARLLAQKSELSTQKSSVTWASNNHANSSDWRDYQYLFPS